jgi:hypothetical protein
VELPQPEVERAAASLLMILGEQNGPYKLHFRNVRLDPRAFVQTSHHLQKRRISRVPASMEPALQLLTVWKRVDTFILERSFVGENRGLDRILRRLKLHAEGRQFGGQNS